MSKLPECIKCGCYISHGNVVCQDCLPEHDAAAARKAREQTIKEFESWNPFQQSFKDFVESLRHQQEKK